MSKSQQRSLVEFGEVIKQYPGEKQVERQVKVDVPGKHFPQLPADDQAKSYSGVAAEFSDRHDFPRHKSWGAAGRQPGIRFVCESDAIDDPSFKGFWVPLGLWNRWRHDTYKENRNAELVYLDELPAEAAPAAATGDGTAVSAPSEGAPIKKYFVVHHEGTHTIQGAGKMAGKVLKAVWYCCKKEGCPASRTPFKQVGSATGQLFTHLESCQPELCRVLRAKSAHSPVMIGEDGLEYLMMSFEESLPHHVLYVRKCFRSFDHFYETRADNGLLEWVQSYDRRALLPHRETCIRLLEVSWHLNCTLQLHCSVSSASACRGSEQPRHAPRQVEHELMVEKIMIFVKAHEMQFGSPCGGSTCDLWSLQSCRDTFACFRGSFVLDGNLMAKSFPELSEFKGKLIDMSPIMAFHSFPESRHTGCALARWKQRLFKEWQMLDFLAWPRRTGRRPTSCATGSSASRRSCATTTTSLARCCTRRARRGSRRATLS